VDTHKEIAVKKNVVLIDFESVQPETLPDLEMTHWHLMVFVGASQAKVPLALAMAMQRMGERAQYLQMSGQGPNALDFHIAFYLGQLAAADPDAVFHVVSKDKGFDPLIQHLKSRHITVERIEVTPHHGRAN
jgi:hypothetical protein